MNSGRHWEDGEVMDLKKATSAALALLATTAIATAVAAPAFADETEGDGSDLVWPDSSDPMDPSTPGYWEGGQNAGGTGEEAQDNNVPYTEGGQHAGGTGNAPQPDEVPYYEEGNNGGGF